MKRVRDNAKRALLIPFTESAQRNLVLQERLDSARARVTVLAPFGTQQPVDRRRADIAAPLLGLPPCAPPSSSYFEYHFQLRQRILLEYLFSSGNSPL
jgi:hypothetical protein